MSDRCDILIVDDQPGVRRLLNEVLVEEGYRVETAGSGTKALELISRLEPRLIILDMKMPGLDGVGTLKELRKMDRKVPVIVMTAFGELEAEEALGTYGVQHYINKPFDLDEVRSFVKQIFANVTESEDFQKIGR